ncbi:MAG: Hsp70 family protein, partial [Vicinamibacteria bacterium]
GGTFDISILEVSDGVMQVKATGGDTFLGGEDFDQRIIDFLVEDFIKSTSIDLSQDRMARQRLKEAAEKAKCDLSTADSTEIVLPFISADSSGPKHLSTTLTRLQYEAMTRDLLSRTEEPCRRCLADAGLKADQIDDVILVGGQTRAPQVVEIVQRVFGRKPNRTINPDECVAMGAAIQTGIMEGEVKSLVLLDVTPYTLGIETMNGTFTPVIDRNSAIPTRRARIFTTVADNQTSVELHVLQGESDMSAYNRSLARFDLTNVPPAPRGLPQIEVGFEIDSDGIVSVSALDQATGRSQSLVIHPASGINEHELERLVGETKLRQVNEKESKEKEKLLQQVSGLVANSQRTLTLLERKLSAEEKTKIQTAIMDTQRLKIEDTISTLQRSLREMEEVAQILSSAMLRA